MNHTSSSETTEPRTQPGWGLLDDGLAELERQAGETQGEEAFLNAVCRQLIEWGLAGAAMWKITAGKRPKLACYHGANGAAEKLAVLAAEQIEAALAGWKAEEAACPLPAAKFGGKNVGLLVPWLQDGSIAGALVMLLPEDVDAAGQRGFGQMGTAVAELLALFHAHHDRRQLREKCEDLQRRQSLVRGLHSSFELQRTAYTVAYDGRAILNCDRVAVLVRKGTSFRVQAVSGAEFVHRRAEVVAAMERLAELVAATGEPLRCAAHEKDLPPQLAEGIANYLEASPANRVGVIPLAQEESPDESATSLGMQPHVEAGPPFAVIVVEQFSTEDQPQLWPRAQQLAETVRAPLRQAWQLQSVPFLPFWLAWQRGAARTKWLSRGAVAAGGLAVLIGILFLVPAEVKLRAAGELQPASRHEIFAPSEGIVTEVLVEHGAKVQKDEPLLQLRSVELDLETQRVAGELETVRKQLAAVQAERLQIKGSDTESRLRQRRLTADEAQMQQQILGLAERQKLLAQQQTDLRILSPAAGSVLTWNPRDRLAERPLRRGDLLLTVADESGPWQVELHLPARQAARLLSAFEGKAASKENWPLKVSFSLSTAPGVVLEGTVREVSQRVNVDEAGESYILVVADIDSKTLPPRTPGAVVFGRIHVGRSSLGVASFHEAIDAAKLWLTW